LIGHTRFQVVVGLILGIAIALIASMELSIWPEVSSKLLWTSRNYIDLDIYLWQNCLQYPQPLQSAQSFRDGLRKE
jgi:hypothetical protein